MMTHLTLSDLTHENESLRPRQRLYEANSIHLQTPRNLAMSLTMEFYGSIGTPFNGDEVLIKKNYQVS